MPQFQAQVPHPLRHHLPALLTPGRVTTPAVRVLFAVFICQSRLEGAAMQIQCDDIGSSERLLRQIGEEEFVDDARTRDANRALLFASFMGRHYHAVQHALGPYRDLRTIVEAAHDLTCLHAAGTDRQAGADAPGRADDRARCTLCLLSRRRSQRDLPARPRCHIVRRAEARREPLKTGEQ